jgi:NHL repeat
MSETHVIAHTSIKGRSVLAALATSILLLLAFVPSSFADKIISEEGEGAGQTAGPGGVAVDSGSGRLYVGDQGNNRVDVFDANGIFEKAFGWGVKDGKAEFEVCTTSCRKGTAGSGNGQFNGPTKVAVDPTTHDVYVVDYGNLRVEKFDAEGKFLLMFGGGVNKTTPGNLCTAASGDTCGAGTDGFGEGELTSNAGLGGGATGIFIGVGGGSVYVIDTRRPEGPGGEFNPAGKYKIRLQKFEPSGTAIAPQHVLLEREEVVAVEMAVESSGDFYVAIGDGIHAIRKYSAATTDQIGEIEGIGGVDALAVDSEEHLFVAADDPSLNRNIAEYDASGVILRRFGYAGFRRSPTGLAPYHSADGDIYTSEVSGFTVGEASRVQHLDIGTGPVGLSCNASPLGNTKATLNSEINPENKATTYHFEYISDADFIANGNSFSGAHPATATPESESIGSDFVLYKVNAQASLIPETKYRCRVVATNADAPAGVTGPEGAFTSLEPLEIQTTWASGVGTEVATLNATVNALGIPTSGYFQYVDDTTYQKDVAELGPTHGFDHASKAPDTGAGEAPIDFGAGESPKTGAALLSGLAPGTSYRFRIVATDEYFPAGLPGPTKAFHTFRPGEGGLPDGRGYELVSPGLKNNAEVGLPAISGGLLEANFARIQAASGSGEAFTYTSWTSFNASEAAPGTNQYLSRRTAAGWGTENISPLGFSANPLEPPYRGFTPDLDFAAFAVDGPPLTPEVQKGFEKNLYLRDNQTGQLRALITEAPQVGPAERFCTGFAGASLDGKHAFFTASGALAGAPVGKGKSLYEFSLYEWSAALGLRLASVLPDGAPATPNENTGFGATPPSSCNMGQAIIAHAVSRDGSVAFWSYGGNYSGAKKPLFARIDGTETVELDAKEIGENAGKGPSGGGRFWTASTDGSKAFFTAPGKLTKDAGAEGQLYRYDTEARTLTDLTPGAVATGVRGVIGASEDGSYVYFVATGALTGEEENPAHQKAVAGANNLYLYHQGEGLRFIANLSSDDSSDWDPTPVQASARLTPDGRYLAFLSNNTESLSGYNNVVLQGEHCQPERYENGLVNGPLCSEAYLYGADAGTLTCVSCNPSGSRPTGPVTLPGWSNPYQGPRYLSDDGQRLFLESRDALSGSDENERRDVYEFERAGKGACSAESPTFVLDSGGCLSLLSSGKNTDESYLLDASADGRDAFIATRQPLLAADLNENYDIYDVREGGGFPEPTQHPACEGEACKPSSISPPAFSGPTTPHFEGPLNAKPKKPHKKRSHHKHKRSHRRAHHNGRAGR